MFGTVRTEAYHRQIPPVLPETDTSPSLVRHQYRYRTLRYVRYYIDASTAGTGADFRTDAGHLGTVGTTSIPLR